MARRSDAVTLQAMAQRTILTVLIVWICCAFGGCQSPFLPMRADELLRRRIDAAVEHELGLLPQENQNRRFITLQPPGEVELALAERREELDTIGPAPIGSPVDPDFGADLTGAEQVEVALNLRDAIHTAVEGNLGVQSSRLQPAISAQDVIAAEAAFDAIFFGGVDVTKTDQPSTVPIVGITTIGTGISASERYRYETGLRKLTRSGGTVSLSTDLTRSQNNAPGISFSPDPAYMAAVRFGLTQPLLRGFGKQVNTATIHLSENAEQSVVEQLRSELLAVISQTEVAYWNLVFAWSDLVIQEWLVSVGEEVRDVLDRRRDFDTKPAQFADAVATVEQRKSNVILARHQVRAASDLLKVLINDPRLPVGSEILIKPSDELVEVPVEYDLRESLTTAISNRPEIKQALLAIDDASIRQMLANNLRLPRLDLSAEIAYSGLNDDPGSSFSELSDADFIDYVLGINFEIPIGNREAEAGYRRSRLQRTGALISYRQAVQQVVLEVKSALRNVITNYQLIQARRSFRVAQAENLRTLLVEEETMAGLTPEFLNLKFQRQSGLATARQQEIQAIVNFDQSVAELYRAMGTGLKMNNINLEVGDHTDDFIP